MFVERGARRISSGALTPAGLFPDARNIGGQARAHGPTVRGRPEGREIVFRS